MTTDNEKECLAIKLPMVGSKKPKNEIIMSKQRRQDAFLAAYKKTGTLTKAFRLSHVPRQRHKHWMATDPEYIEKFVEAQEEANEYLENEARRRAVEGWQEPVFYEGEICGHKQKYSDPLLMFLLKGALPQKYKERYEHSGDKDNPVNVAFDLTGLSDQELKTLEQIVDKMGDNDG